MSKDLSTQLPNSPELQPIPSAAAKFWQFFSTILMVGGFGLIGMGGWMFVDQQIEASKPPPARIMEVSLEDLVTETPTTASVLTPRPSPTLARSTATPRNQAHDRLHNPAAAPETAAGLPSATATPKPTATNSAATDTAAQSQTDKPAAELTAVAAKLLEEIFPVLPTPLFSEPAIEGEAEADSNPEPEAVVSEPEVSTETEIALPEPTVTVEGVASEGLSLADNPLVVVESEPAPGASTGEASEAPAAGEAQVIDLPPAPPVTRIVAEAIGLDSDVIEVGWNQLVQNGVTHNVWVVADYAAGWHNNSALPGQSGNIVMSAHHNIKGEVFRYIIDLEPGEIVTLYDEQGSHDYIIEDKFIVKDKGEPEAVRRANARWIGPFNEERLTMVTCWPYNNNTHRVIVIGKPVGEAQAGG